jgi:UDP-glucose 4-epimerase
MMHEIKSTLRLRTRPKVDVFGTDYPTPDGTLHPRLYSHVRSRARAFRCAGVSARRRRVGHANCGYGRFSVPDVIETVKRVSGVDFKVEFASRLVGDPTQIVAASDRAGSLLKWQPLFDDLQNIVCHALAWERKLLTRAS